MSRPDGEVIGRLRELCGAATVALSAAGAGVSVMTREGVHGTSAASDPRTARLEELQFTCGEGPCIDAYAARHPVLVPDLTDVVRRWPAYAPAAHDAGARAVFAFPLQVGASGLGVLDVFRTRIGPLSAAEVGSALAIAALAADALVVGAAADARDPAGIDGVIENRIELFQAQGMVMIQLGIPIAEALVRIRAHAYAENRSLGDVAADIIARRLRFEGS